MDRIVKGTAATISVTLYSDGTATNPTPDSATVEVLRADGSILVASTAATDAGTGVFTYTLTPTHTASLDVLTARWTATIDGFAQTVETLVEIVGGVYFTVAELRAMGKPLDNPTNYPTATLVAARSAAEESLEDACGVAFVPRYARETLDGNGTRGLSLRWPKVRAVTAGSVAGVALTETQLGEIKSTSIGLYWPTYWASGTSNVVVGYEHGYDTTPPRVKRAALILAKDWLIDSPFGDRVLRIETDTESFSRSWRGFGLPEVDETVKAYDYTLPIG